MQLAAVGIDAPADQMQDVGILVTGDAAQFVALGGHLAVGVVLVDAAGAARQGDLAQTAGGVPVGLGYDSPPGLVGDLQPAK